MKHKSNPKVLPEPSEPIATKDRDSREEAFINALMVTDSIPTAGRMAGYSDSYSEFGLYAKFKDQRFQTKMIEHFKAHCFTDLPSIIKINKLGLNQIKKDLEAGSIESASKLKHIPRQLLEITKLLSPDLHGTTINLVNVESLQAMILNKVQKDEQEDDK